MKGSLDVNIFRLGFSTSGINVPDATLAPWLGLTMGEVEGRALPITLLP